ncbi:MAG: alpha/beta fold hydrolase [Pseudomonadota bacterium]
MAISPDPKPDPLILLPGLMCDTRVFRPQFNEFNSQLRFKVADLSKDASVPGMAMRVLSSAPPTFSLLGLSMGGIVAMEIIKRAPRRVTRIALLDTNYKAEAREVADNRIRQINMAYAGQLEDVMRDEMKPNYLADGPEREKVLDLCMSMAKFHGPRVFERQSKALMNRPDQTESLGGINVPTLVMCGREDALCPVSRHEKMAELIPGADLQVIEDAGHLPVLEKPAETNAAIGKWLGLS